VRGRRFAELPDPFPPLVAMRETRYGLVSMVNGLASLAHRE
jgi:hypothetical protein